MKTLFSYPSRQAQDLNKPKVYIAGKIGKNDFRHDLVSGLRGWEYDDGPIDCGSFTYVGPFFQSCDHGCRHGPGTHGVAGIGCDDEKVSRRTVKSQNQCCLQTADLVFAFIEAPDAHGTVWELGWADCFGLSEYVFFGPGFDPDDFWYASDSSLAPKANLISGDELPATFKRVLADWRERQ